MTVFEGFGGNCWLPRASVSAAISACCSLQPANMEANGGFEEKEAGG